MFRLLKYTVYAMAFMAGAYIVQEISSGHIRPQDAIKDVSQQFSSKTSQLMQNTYENSMLNFRQTMDEAVQNSEDMIHQAVSE